MSYPIKVFKSCFLVECRVLEVAENTEFYNWALIKKENESSKFYSYFFEIQPEEQNNTNIDIYLREKLNNYLKYNNNDICFDINDSKFNSKLELFLTKYELISDPFYSDSLIGITLKTKRPIRLLDINYMVFNTDKHNYNSLLVEYARENNFDGITGFNDMCNGNRYIQLFDTANTCTVDNTFDVSEYTNKEFDILEEETKLDSCSNMIDSIMFSYANNKFHKTTLFKYPDIIYNYNKEIRDYVWNNLYYPRKSVSTNTLSVTTNNEIIV